MSTFTQINDWLVSESGRIGPDINQKVMAKQTPWINLHRRDFWPDEMGNEISTYVFERAKLRAPAVDWANVTDSGADVANGGTCVPPADEVAFSQTFRTYNLQQKALWGPRVCVNTLRYRFERVKQMTACVKALSDQIHETLVDRARSEHLRLGANNVLLNSGFALNGSDYNSSYFPIPIAATAGAAQGVSTLTNGYLEYIYEYLNHQGAQDGSMGKIDGRAVYGLITSARTSRRIIHANGRIREDFRYSDRNETLLAPMGIKHNYNGFVHMVDDKTPRWNSYDTRASATPGTAGGTVSITNNTRTATFSVAVPNLTVGSQLVIGANSYTVKAVAANLLSATLDRDVTPAVVTQPYFLWLKATEYVLDGTHIRPNPLWLNAEFEDSYLYHQDMAVCLVPKPITSVSEAKFMPVDYSGAHSWKVYEDEEKNPDGTIGRFRSVLSTGTRPENPEFGIVIRHRTCPTAFGALTDCANISAALI
jgi:hypothetical protein